MYKKQTMAEVISHLTYASYTILSHVVNIIVKLEKLLVNRLLIHTILSQLFEIWFYLTFHPKDRRCTGSGIKPKAPSK